MEPECRGIDPFSSDDLWRLSKFSTLALQPLEPLPRNDELLGLAEGAFKNPLKLFDLGGGPVRQLGACKDDSTESDLPLDSTADVSGETSTGPDTVDKDTPAEVTDIWLLDIFGNMLESKFTIRSWEKYQDSEFCEPVSAYFSESGAKGFDAALTNISVNDKPQYNGRMVRSDTFFHALLQLGLGWSSIFFRFNGYNGACDRPLGDIRVPGVSLPTAKSIIDGILKCGTDMRRLRTFVESSLTGSEGSSALFNFSDSVSTIICVLEKHIFMSSRHMVSLLQTKALFQRPAELVGALTSILDAIKGDESDAEVISIVFGKIACLCQEFAWMESFFYDVAAHVVSPFLRFVEAWIGLWPETSILAEQATCGKDLDLEYLESDENNKTKSSMGDYSYFLKQIPSFIPANQAELIFETGRSLWLLKRSCSRHPIANTAILRTSDPPRLHCFPTWADIIKVQDRAHQYEARLRDEILRYNLARASKQGPLPEFTDDFLQDETRDMVATHTFELFDLEDKNNVTGLLTTSSSIEGDKLSRLLDGTKDTELNPPENSFGPELTSTIYLSLGSVLSSQALLVDFACLHLLFKEHKIRYHLTLQRRFQLLGDGYFASRLSHLLFDPEMRSGERESGKLRTGIQTGLRLGSRDTWPPASSELRLVLISLLSECYFEDHNLEDAIGLRFDKEGELPGGLSFAIRELSEEEIARCKDPNAIEALDFLRLHYKAPAALERVITRRSLEKYDRLFKHLLRLTRMVAVVNGFIRDSTSRSSLSGDTHNVFQKFRIDSQHFILAFSGYCFHTGIESPWLRFQDTLSRIEHCLDRGDIDDTISAAHSIPWLRDYHEDILDQMLFALFLSKRHAQAASLLEKIFHTILTFAPLSRMDGTNGIRHQNEAAASQLYILFRKQTSAFVDYLRSLSTGKASSKASNRSDSHFALPAYSTSVFDQLLSRLDVRAYY